MQGPSGLSLLICCSSGKFNLKNGEQSIAETLVLNSMGPRAVIASTGDNSYLSNIIMGQAFVKSFNRSPETVGELLIGAQRFFKQIDISHQLNNQNEALLFNILGDPTVRL